jgi:hypothetical protein
MWVGNREKSTAFADEVPGDETGDHRDEGEGRAGRPREHRLASFGWRGEHTSAGTSAGDQKQHPRSDRYYADIDNINNTVITIVNILPIVS